MACATLKRSHDWDPLSSPATGNARPAKRICSASTKNQVSNVCPLKQPSPFSEVEPRITAGTYAAFFPMDFIAPDSAFVSNRFCLISFYPLYRGDLC